MDQFPAAVSEFIGAYVYALRDPVSRRVFYVGKGNGSRVFAHANGVLDEEDGSLKNEVIRNIRAAGHEVEMFIIQHGLGDDPDSMKSHAHQTESALFGLLSLLDPGLDNEYFSLTNLVSPPTYNEYGLRSTADVVAQYGSPADASLLPHGSLLIKPTLTWRFRMPSAELYEYTRGWWKMSLDRASEIRYVFSIPKFVIRAVFEVPAGGWRNQAEGDRGWERSMGQGRVGFEGRDVSEKFPELLNRSVEHLFNPGQGKRKDWKYLDDAAAKKILRAGGVPPWNYLG